MPIIVYDKEIPFSYEIFSKLGKMVPIDTDNVDWDIINSAEILLIRSNIKIDSKLIANAEKLKVICTASAGVEHIDTVYADQRGITIFNAKGSNVQAVADYVLAAFFAMFKRVPFMEKRVGIIGLGMIGQEVYRRFTSLGCYCVGYDPFNSKQSFNIGKIDDILSCDVITFHIPLIKEGLQKTYHFFSKREISALRPGTFLINTSRGEVIDEDALLSHMRKKNNLKLAFDVWNGEPNINKEMTTYCELATPHIAGWSETARKDAMIMLFEKASSYYNLNKLNFFRGQSNKFQEKKQEILTHYPPDFMDLLSTMLEKCVDIKTHSYNFKLALNSQKNAMTVFNASRSAYRSRAQLSDFFTSNNELSYKERKILKNFGIPFIQLSSRQKLISEIKCKL
ncbi:MAG: hypothetical protein EPO11_10670 [Gammaproteobacteria bacterium]|nr:MAG: hypothetical protein EPO11_10670 [Gammaproteobacteria bacterium]